MTWSHQQRWLKITDNENNLTKIWRRHGKATPSALLAFCEGNPPVTSAFPRQRANNAGVDVSLDVRLDEWLNKDSSYRWFKMLIVTSL